MGRSEKNIVSIVFKIVESTLSFDEISSYLNIQEDDQIFSSKNAWSVQTNGSARLVDEWQNLKDLLRAGWHKIPQLIAMGGRVEIIFRSHIEDRYPAIIMSPQIIKDIQYLKATVQMV